MWRKKSRHKGNQLGAFLSLNELFLTKNKITRNWKDETKSQRKRYIKDFIYTFYSIKAYFFSSTYDHFTKSTFQPSLAFNIGNDHTKSHRNAKRFIQIKHVCLYQLRKAEDGLHQKRNGSAVNQTKNGFFKVSFAKSWFMFFCWHNYGFPKPCKT